MFDNELALADVNTFDDAFAGGLLGCLRDNESLRRVQWSGVGHAAADNDRRSEHHYEFRSAKTTVPHHYPLFYSVYRGFVN
jgi:hypothetical protein